MKRIGLLLASIFVLACFHPVMATTDESAGAPDAASLAADDTWNPELMATMYGGPGDDFVRAVAVDAQGNIIVAGTTDSKAFPVVNPYQATWACGNTEGSVGTLVKMNPAGSEVLWATYFGDGCDDIIYDIFVDTSDRIFLVGQTRSPDFPTLGDPLTPAEGEPCLIEHGLATGYLCTTQGFVAWFDAEGQLLYSSIFGGEENEILRAVQVRNNVAYIAGRTFSPTIPGVTTLHNLGPGGGGDAIVARISLTQPQVLSLTRLGGADNDIITKLALDTEGQIHITGETQSDNFPMMEPVQALSRGERDAFVGRLNPTGSTLTFATYWGGSDNETVTGLGVDSRGNVYAGGYTASDDVLTTPDVVSPSQLGKQDLFAVSFTITGTLRYSTYLGGSGNDSLSELAVDSTGSVYLVGTTNSADFPLRDPRNEYGGGYDGFLSQLNDTATELIYSTYVGSADTELMLGLAVHGKSQVTMVGRTSTAFPTTPGVVQPEPSTCTPSADTSCVDMIVTTWSLLPWTLIVYSAFDNNLAGLADELHNYELVADNPNVEIIQLLDTNPSYIDSEGPFDFKDSRYYVIQHNPRGLYGIADYQEGVTVFSKEELATDEPQTLVDFVNWARETYPSRYVALFLSSHGTGITGAMLDAHGNRGGGTFMSVKEIGQALDAITDGGKDKIDVLHMIACLMGMIEPAYEWRNSVDYYVASEQIYISDALQAISHVQSITGTITPRLLAIRMADDLAELHGILNPPFRDTVVPHTISVADLTKADALHAAVHEFGDTMEPFLRAYTGTDYSGIAELLQVQRFDSDGDSVIERTDEYADLYHWVSLLHENVPDEGVKASAKEVMDRIEEYIIHQRVASGSSRYGTWDHANANGVAVFLPWYPRTFYNASNLSFLQPPPASVGARDGLVDSGGWLGMLDTLIALNNPDATEDPVPPPLQTLRRLSDESPQATDLYLPFVRR